MRSKTKQLFLVFAGHGPSVYLVTRRGRVQTEIGISKGKIKQSNGNSAGSVRCELKSGNSKQLTCGSLLAENADDGRTMVSADIVTVICGMLDLEVAPAPSTQYRIGLVFFF